MSRLALVSVWLLAAAALALGGCGGGDSSTSAEPSTATEPSSTSPTTSEEPEGVTQVEIPVELRAAVAKAAASGVPVRIPPALLEVPLPGANHAEVLRSPPDSYTLGLASKPRCRFKSDCVVAIFSGSADGEEPSGPKLQLTAGIEGAYEPGRCGPGCKFGTVVWRQDGDLYGVGVPGASVSELMVLANEAIAAEPAAEARR